MTLIANASPYVPDGKTEADLPLVSIVTVVFNGAKYLEEAMHSVFSQTYPTMEYIVIDGGSTDGSLEIIDRHLNKIDKFISEPDRGIYDAMNKGIGLAGGKLIGMVNADDGLYPDALEKVVHRYLSAKNAGFVYGPVDLINEYGQVVGRTAAFAENEIEHRRRLEMPFAHPSCFVDREVYEKAGLYDQSFPLCADYDFIWRMMDAGYKGVRMDQPIARFRWGGKSHGMASFKETLRLHKKYGIPWLIRYRVFVASMIKWRLFRMLPGPAIRFVKQFRNKSRHTFFSPPGQAR